LSSGGRQRERERERETGRQRTHSERRMEDFLSVGMGQGPTYWIMISSSVVKRKMTIIMITMIADAELNKIHTGSSDILDTVLKMTRFDNSNFKSNNIIYILFK
jgi:hypothetical protein